MSASVLVTGTLFRAPEQRMSKAGKPFWTATIKVKSGESVEWWKICAFGESAGAELARLDDGDAVSVRGRLEVGTYEQGGETRIRLHRSALSRMREGCKSRSGQAKAVGARAWLYERVGAREQSLPRRASDLHRVRIAGDRRRSSHPPSWQQQALLDARELAADVQALP